RPRRETAEQGLTPCNAASESAPGIYATPPRRFSWAGKPSKPDGAPGLAGAARGWRRQVGPHRFDRVADLVHGFLQLLGGHAELLAPVPAFPVFVDIDA